VLSFPQRQSRPSMPLAGGNAMPKQQPQDLPTEDVNSSEMDIPTFIRRQMD